jgi:Ca-activated chloride channel family protein
MMKQKQLILTLALIVVAMSACSTDSVEPVARPEPGKTNTTTTEPVPPPGTVRERLDRPADAAKQDRDEGKGEADRRQLASEEAVAESPAPLTAGRAVAKQSRVAKEQHFAAQPGVATANLDAIRAPSEPLDRENYAHFDDNPLKRVVDHPVSTFSIDVDTGAYSNARRMLNAGRLPVQDAVRVEEFINYFGYDYAAPSDRSRPFNIITEVGPNPWNSKTHLLHVGLKGYEVPRSQIPASNLVFLIDVSGSMRSDDKIGLLKTSLKMLTRELRPADRISIVVYAGASGVVLEPVSGSEKGKIIAALDGLSAGGRTNGAAGIRLAYAMAEQAFVAGGINRVLLATDGDFNVGTTSFEALKDLVEEKRKTGISLTTLGFGTGNYNDHLMEQLADAGNGNYAYIDTLNEARKVLVEQMSATLQTIAKDVKIQIEFNPDVVAEYRLVGYENRMLAREDFNNDQVDAGEIGAGHTVTAIYEVALANSDGQRIDPLRYQKEQSLDPVRNSELAFLRLRYKAPDGDTSKLIEQPIRKADLKRELSATSADFRFAAAVAGFGQLLRGAKYMEAFDYDDVRSLANGAKGGDSFGYRGEFVTLVNLAQSLSGQTAAQVTR